MFGGFGGATGGFGQPQQQQQQQQTSLFGQPQPQQQVAGSSGFSFGAPAPAVQTGFGGGTGLFGGGAASAANAAPTTTGFGGSSLFGGGAKPPGTSAFGGGGMGVGGFGGAMGQQQQQQQQQQLQTSLSNNQGTGNPPYVPTQDKDGGVGAAMTVFQSISAMPAYKNFSFEELRLQDYILGKKFSTGTAGASGAFGQPSGFGGLQSGAASTSVFGGGFGGGGVGATTTTGGGLFGGTVGGAASSAFGAPAAQTNTSSAFGFGGGVAATTGSSLFGGGAQQQPSLFGGASNTSAASTPFGGQPAAGTFAAPASTGFGFGGQQQQQQQVKPAFGGFGGQATPAVGGFGAAANTTSAFGAPAAGGGLFGKTAATTGGGGFGGFGAPATQPTNSLFGGGAATATNTGAGGLFGGNAVQANTAGGLFGAKPAGGIFGGPAATTTGATTSLFGAPAPAATGLFGGGTQQNTGFGATPAPGGGLFGNQQQQQQPAVGGFGALGGQQQPLGGSLFGAKPATTQPATGGFGGFGGGGGLNLGGQTSSTTTGSNLFGGGATGGLGGISNSGFGATSNPISTTNTGGLFGTNPLGAGIGGSFGGGGIAGTTSTLGGGGSLFSNFQQQQPQQQQLQQQQQPLMQAGIDKNPYGTNPLFNVPSDGSGSVYESAKQPALIQPPAEKKNAALAPHYKVTPRSASKMKLRGFSPSPLTTAAGGMRGVDAAAAATGGRRLHIFDGAAAKNDHILGLDSRFQPRRSVKKLVIQDGSSASEGLSSKSPFSPFTPSGGGGKSGLTPESSGIKSKMKVTFDPTLEDEAHSFALENPVDVTGDEDGSFSRTPSKTHTSGMAGGSAPSSLKSTPIHGHAGSLSSSSLVVKSPPSAHSSRHSPSPRKSPAKSAEYIMIPSFEKLMSMTDEQLSCVEDFEVSLDGIGSVKFLEPVDLLDKFTSVNRSAIANIPGTLIILSPKLCTVYPDEEYKPPVGMGLNVKAEIQLQGCWPIDKSTREPITEASDPRYDRHLQKLEEMPETDFVGFHPATGTWRFRVNHFSKYGLVDDDDEEQPPTHHQEQQPPHSTIPATAPQIYELDVQEGDEEEEYYEDEEEYHVVEEDDEFEEEGEYGDELEIGYEEEEEGNYEEEVEYDQQQPGYEDDDNGSFEDESMSYLQEDSFAKIQGFRSKNMVRPVDDLRVLAASTTRTQQYRPTSSLRNVLQHDEEEEEEEYIEEEYIEEESNVILEEHDMGDDSAMGTFDDDAPPTLTLHEMPTSAKKLPFNRMGMARKVQRMQTTLFPPPSATTFSPLKKTPFSPAPPSSLNPRPLSSFDSNINKASSPPYKRTHDWSGSSDDDDNNYNISINKMDSTFSPISTLRTSPPRWRVEQAVPDREISDAESETARPFLKPTSSPVKSTSVGSGGGFVPTVSVASLSCVPSMDCSMLTTGAGELGGAKRTGNYIDSGLSMGRSFRAGWGPQGQIVTIGSRSKEKSSNIEFSKVSIRQVCIFENQSKEKLEIEKQKHKALLEVIASHSVVQQSRLNENRVRVVIADSSKKAAVSSSDVIDLSVALSEKAEFARIAEKAQALAGSTTSDDEVLLWKLCSALWDERPLSAQERQKLSENQILLIEDSLKRERVSIWLKEAVSKAVEESIISNPSPSFKLFSLLTGRQMGKAVQEAIKTKDFKLAMIVTQLGGAGSRLSVPNILPNSRIQSSAGHGVPGKNGTDEVVRECISSQVQIWKTMMNSSTTPLMDEDRFNCWVLCGGEFIKYSPEMFLRLSDWKRTWGLFLWYGDGGYWGLKESLKQYSEAILGGRSLIRQPLPGYIERAGSKRSELIKSKSKWMPRNETPLDCMFHLLRLYAENADYKLETVLRPETISGDCMDYRISWILLVFLNQVKKVGEFSDAQLARQQDAQVVVVPSAKNDLITTSLIHQLEVLGLWTWACFVALFLKSPMRREAVIRDLISRYFPLSDHSGSCYGMILQEESAVSTPPSPPSSVSTNALSTEWKFLVETLSIPPVWIFEAKVVKSGYERNIFSQIVALIDSQNYAVAHRLILLKIAPNAVISSNLGLLKAFLNRINPNAVSEWSNAGGLFLEYIKLQELLPRTIENASTLLPTSASHLEELKKRWVPMIQNFLTALSRARSADWVVYLKRACVLSGLVAEDVGKALMNTRACLAEMAGQVSVLLTECENLTQLDQNIERHGFLAALPLSEDHRLVRLHRLSSDIFVTLLT